MTALPEWTPETIAAARARLEHDTRPGVAEEVERYRAVVASWGHPKRCDGSSCGPLGECLFCGDDQGERARCVRG